MLSLWAASLSLFFFRNLKMGYFSQHHVDQLNMNMNSVQLLQSRFPGTY